MRRLLIAALAVAAAAGAGTAMAGGLLNGKGAAEGVSVQPAKLVAVCHCKRGPRGPRGFQGPQGEQGPKGDTGAQGPAGTSSPAIFAVVDGNGTLAHGTAVSVSHAVVGEYTLTFGQNLDNCAAVAAPGGHKTGTGPSAIAVGFANASTNGNTVTVITRVVSPPGVMEPSDRSFHLIVMCPVG